MDDAMVDGADRQEMWLEYIPLDRLERFPRNPKLHSDKILESMKEYGYVNPMIIDETTGRLVAGHGRLEKLQTMKAIGSVPPERIKVAEDGGWLAPVIRGIHFASEEQAERYLIDDNLIPQLGGWDQALLNEVAQAVHPISIDTKQIDEAIKTILTTTTPLTTPQLDPVDITNDGSGELDESNESGGESDAADGADDAEIPDEFRHILDIDDNMVWPSSNMYGIPDLLSEKLLDRLPEPLDTWGDRQTTPDDGKMWWLYNQGSAATSGLPGERALLALFSWDKVLEGWWKTPGYMAARFLKMGIKTAVVPDFSVWDSQPVANQLWSVQRSMWIGRFLQEAGYHVIPRIEYFVCRSKLPPGTPGTPTQCDTTNDMHDPLCPKSYTLAGIPHGALVVATQMHTGFAEEHVEGLQMALITAITKIQPRQLLVYASKRGEKLVEAIGGDITELGCEMIVLPAVERKRRIFARQAEKDPLLLKLRQHKREGEPARATSPDK